MILLCIAVNLLLFPFIKTRNSSNSFTFRGALKYYTPSLRFYRYTFVYVSFFLGIVSFAILNGIFAFGLYIALLSTFFVFYRRKILEEKTLFSQIAPQFRKYFKYIKDPRTFSDSIVYFTILILSFATIAIALVIVFA